MQYTVDDINSDKYCTLAQAKTHLRIESDYTNDDDLITASIEAAASQIENHCAVLFGTRDFTIQLSQLSGKIDLPIYPVQSITAVSYKDVDGSDQSIASDSVKLFQLDQQRKASIHILGNLPAVEKDNPIAVTITGSCGLGKVPSAVKKATKLLIGDSDTYREDRQMAGTDRAVSKLLRPYKY